MTMHTEDTDEGERTVGRVAPAPGDLFVNNGTVVGVFGARKHPKYNPTNRKAKRQRCKATRRARKATARLSKKV